MAANTPKTPSSGASPGSLHRATNPATTGRQAGHATIPHDRPVALMTSGAPLLNPRSCVTCRRRRVRCDKTMPCSNCRRAQCDCIYPAPGRAPRHTRLAPTGPATGQSEREMDLLGRLRKLEGLVYEMSGQGTASENDMEVSNGESPLASEKSKNAKDVVQAATEKVKRESENTDFSKINKQLGRLVLHDGDSTPRYVNSGFFVKLNDEVRSPLQS